MMSIVRVTEADHQTNNKITDNDHIPRHLTDKQTDFMVVNKSFSLNMRGLMLFNYRTTKTTVIDPIYFQIHRVCVHSNNPNIYPKTSQQTFSFDIFGVYNFEGDDWKIESLFTYVFNGTISRLCNISFVLLIYAS